jgi:hypothetical protein
MNSFNKRVVTYLSERYKKQLQEICDDREEKEAFIVREILKEYFEINKAYIEKASKFKISN